MVLALTLKKTILVPLKSLCTFVENQLKEGSGGDGIPAELFQILKDDAV